MAGSRVARQDRSWDRQGPIVIGVVRDASTIVLGALEPLEFYAPLAQGDAPESVLLLRVSGRPEDSVRRLKDTARALDTRLLPAAHSVGESYDREVQNVSHVLGIVSILGTVAILLAAIGLAGLAGYTVAQRTREIGLRMALGARGGQVVRAMLAPMSRPIAIGFVCGGMGGSAVAKILRSGLPGLGGLNPLDPLGYLMAMGFFTTVVALAVLAPARRAIRIHPGKALQHE